MDFGSSSFWRLKVGTQEGIPDFDIEMAEGGSCIPFSTGNCKY